MRQAGVCGMEEGEWACKNVTSEMNKAIHIDLPPRPPAFRRTENHQADYQILAVDFRNFKFEIQTHLRLEGLLIKGLPCRLQQLLQQLPAALVFQQLAKHAPQALGIHSQRRLLASRWRGSNSCRDCCCCCCCGNCYCCCGCCCCRRCCGGRAFCDGGRGACGLDGGGTGCLGCCCGHRRPEGGGAAAGCQAHNTLKCILASSVVNCEVHWECFGGCNWFCAGLRIASCGGGYLVHAYEHACAPGICSDRHAVETIILPRVPQPALF